MIKCNNCKKELTENNWFSSLMKKNSKICKSCHLKNGQKWRHEHPKRTYELTKRYIAKHPHYQRDWTRKERALIRKEMISAYGGKCRMCGISDIEVLDLDHVKNNGGTERKRGMYGWTLYRWLRKNKYPDTEYQLLCRNCNWKKELERLKSQKK